MNNFLFKLSTLAIKSAQSFGCWFKKRCCCIYCQFGLHVNVMKSESLPQFHIYIMASQHHSIICFGPQQMLRRIWWTLWCFQNHHHHHPVHQSALSILLISRLFDSFRCNSAFWLQPYQSCQPCIVQTDIFLLEYYLTHPMIHYSICITTHSH